MDHHTLESGIVLEFIQKNWMLQYVRWTKAVNRNKSGIGVVSARLVKGGMLYLVLDRTKQVNQIRSMCTTKYVHFYFYRITVT